MKKLKLNDLAKQVMTEREIQQIKGGNKGCGDLCQCSCYYENNGGSSTAANGKAIRIDALVQ